MAPDSGRTEGNHGGHTGGLEEDFRFNVVAFTTFFKHFAQPCLFRHFDKRAVGKNVGNFEQNPESKWESIFR